MQTHDVKRKTKQKKSKLVGRGGLRGKTSGAGHKGQKARSGTPRPEMRDIIKKLPKMRGYGKNRARTVNSGRDIIETVTLAVLEANFKAGDAVRPKNLADLGLVKTRSGKTPSIKILGQGDITKALVCYDCDVSATAIEKIEKAGGKVIKKS
ncbi:50S ribosomal protein L15 [Candidatus Parcubacteria bacterium]|nr:50S ribosomal protein L15 [Candidatus Parcubacteria bacterium]